MAFVVLSVELYNFLLYVLAISVLFGRFCFVPASRSGPIVFTIYTTFITCIAIHARYFSFAPDISSIDVHNSNVTYYLQYVQIIPITPTPLISDSRS